MPRNISTKRVLGVFRAMALPVKEQTIIPGILFPHAGPSGRGAWVPCATGATGKNALNTVWRYGFWPALSTTPPHACLFSAKTFEAATTDHFCFVSNFPRTQFINLHHLHINLHHLHVLRTSVAPPHRIFQRIFSVFLLEISFFLFRIYVSWVKAAIASNAAVAYTPNRGQ